MRVAMAQRILIRFMGKWRLTRATIRMWRVRRRTLRVIRRMWRARRRVMMISI